MAFPERLSLHELAVMAARIAVKEGAGEAEIYAVKERSYAATAASNRIEGLNIVDETGIGVRVAVGKRTGFAYTTSLSRRGLEEAVREAIALARTSSEDKYWQGFPYPSPSYPEPGSIYSPSLARIDPSEVVEGLAGLVSVVRDEGASLVMGAAYVSTIERVIVNTNGVYRVDAGTISAAYAEVSMKAGDTTTPGVYELESSRTVMVSPARVGERAIAKAKMCLRRASIDSARKTTVVFSPKAFAQLLRATLLESLLGDNVVRGRSIFRDKLDKQVASEKITIVDNGVLKGGDNTWRFDGEGVAMQKTTLIEKGVLRGFVYDHYWGLRAGLSSTGNAVRAGYASRPSPGFTNIVVTGGDAREEELLEGSEVIYVEDIQGAHTSNPETGEYSVLTNPAILYREGEPVGWVPGLMVSGNMYREIMENLEMLGRSTAHPLTGFYLPAARFSNIVVAPKQ